MKRVEVKINDTGVEMNPHSNWKSVNEIEVATLLHAGANKIEARVFNHNGPPALWLYLSADGFSLRSDETWEASFAGSNLRNTALASHPKIPGPGNAIASDERTGASLTESWPIWISFLAIAAAFQLFAFRRAGHSNTDQSSPAKRWVLLFAVLWLALFINDARLLPFHAGFDSKEHLNYIKYIQERHVLPLPTEGWEMYQPPLYYLVSAGTLSACGLSIDDPASVGVLRLLGAIFGITQFLVAFANLRLLLPDRVALVGFLLAASLSMHLYLSQYVTNEILASCLATTAVYLSLRLLKTDRPRPAQYAWIGTAIGAAMLTKATGILLLPAIITAIAFQQARARTSTVQWFKNFGALLACCFAVCGWHYGRIWMKFGTPLLGNWEVTSGFAWWQEPGYHTVTDYIRIGRSLTSPLFSGFAGFADGIYSTLWGDGLCGGLAGLTYAWNHQLLLAGYLWALIPTTLIVTGAAMTAIRFVRKPTGDLFFLLSLSLLVGLAVIFMTLKVASYAQVKAFYGLSALTPLCFFAAIGWEAITRRNRPLQIVIGTFFMVWVMNSFATYWIIPSVPQHLYAVQALRGQGKIDRALDESAKAIRVDTSSAIGRRFYSLNLSDQGRDREAIEEAERAVELAPNNSSVHLQLAISTKSTDLERSILEARRAIELGLENSSAYEFLMSCYLESHRLEEGIELGREWLAVTPYGADAHLGLSLMFAEKGDLVSAAQHVGYVMMFRPDLDQAHAKLRQILITLTKRSGALEQLRLIADGAPDSPRMLDELAWLLATHPDPSVRDGVQATRLAERACLLTDRRIPALLDTLSSAYAEAGQFTKGITVGEEALTLARSVKDAAGIALAEKILASIRQKVPYRDQPVEE